MSRRLQQVIGGALVAAVLTVAAMDEARTADHGAAARSPAPAPPARPLTPEEQQKQDEDLARRGLIFLAPMLINPDPSHLEDQ